MWVGQLAKGLGVIPSGAEKTGRFIPAHGISQTKIDEIVKQQQAKVIRLKGSIAASKALGAFASIREMRATEREFAAAGIPLKKIKHGVVVPMDPTGKALTVQQHLLRQTQGQAAAVGTELYKYAVKTGYLEERVTGLRGDVRSLQEQLEHRPVVEKAVFGFDWGLPDLSGLKEPLIIAAVAIGALLFLPSIIGAFKK